MIASKQFEIPVYGSLTTLIIFDNNWKEVVKKLDKIGFTTDDIKDWDFVYGLQMAQTIKRKRRFVTILKKGKNLESYFVHELYHLTQDILEWKDVDYKKHGQNEAYAYLNETLYKKLMPFVRQHIPNVKTTAKRKKKK